MGENENSAWMMFVTAITAVWVLVTFFRDRNSSGLANSARLMQLLHDIDKELLADPSIIIFFESSADQNDTDFRDRSRLAEPTFIKAKTIAYRWLNVFDELLSISAEANSWFTRLFNLILWLPPVIDEADWKNYMMKKLCHPLYKSILDHEPQIFGKSLRGFWDRNEKEIANLKVDCFSW